jgi:hypothetical protein
MSRTGMLFIGIAGNVLAVDRATGQELWRVRRKGFDFVNVVLEDGDLISTWRRMASASWCSRQGTRRAAAKRHPSMSLSS